MEEYIRVPNRKNKREAVKRLMRGTGFSSREQVLWFCVLERTILDIGMNSGNNSDVFFKDKGFLSGVLENSGVARGYLFRILRECSVWP